MPRNVTSLLNHITLSITSSNLSSYLSYFFSFLSKNKAKTADAKLARATKWIGAVFIILTLILNIL